MLFLAQRIVVGVRGGQVTPWLNNRRDPRRFASRAERRRHLEGVAAALHHGFFRRKNRLRLASHMSIIAAGLSYSDASYPLIIRSGHAMSETQIG